jgi:hypothetical protein
VFEDEEEHNEEDDEGVRKKSDKVINETVGGIPDCATSNDIIQAAASRNIRLQLNKMPEKFNQVADVLIEI